MKTRLLVLAPLLAGHALAASAAPLPMKAMSWSLPRDGHKWVVQSQEANDRGLTTQFLPAGDSPAAWTEMLVQQTTFTDSGVRHFVDLYRTELLKADRAAVPAETLNADASITLTFASDKTGQTTVRRFMRGTDGIYMLAYYVRTAARNADTLARWREAIDGATLSPNPERKN